MPAVDKPPMIAAALGGLGLIPFVGLSVATFLAPAAMQPDLSFALLAYGATILSFLGGIHWGLATAAHTLTPRARTFQMSISVLPQLLGWVALLVPSPLGHAFTAAGLLLILLADAGAVRTLIAPAWFLQLRWPLSCVAAIALLAVSVRL